MSGLNAQRGVLTRELSRLDKHISKMYHDLEGIDISQEYALSYVTQLHDVLKKRRVVKDEMARLDAVLNPLKNVVNDVDSAVRSRRKVSRRWRRAYKMRLTIEEVLTTTN